MILDITQGIVNAVISVIAFLFSFVLDLVFGLFGEITLPGFSTYSSYLIRFWDLVFDFFGWFRSVFVIDSFSITLISSMLIIKFTYKPIISIVKMFIGWLSKFKL